jgi:hypothetical protein
MKHSILRDIPKREPCTGRITIVVPESLEERLKRLKYELHLNDIRFQDLARAKLSKLAEEIEDYLATKDNAG